MKKTILIIDDDRDTLDLLEYLVHESNHNVIVRSDVISLASIQEINPDMILMDHWVNGKKGCDLCVEIKRNSVTADIPVIMVSAINEIGQIAMDSGADGCIPKPFDIDELCDVINCYLNLAPQ